MRVVLYILTALVAWLGLRHLISIIIGRSQRGTLKPGQRVCHSVSLVLLWSACGFSLCLDSFWPLVVGSAVSFLFDRLVIWSGLKVHRLDIALFAAVGLDDIQEVKRLLSLGADVNWRESKYGVSSIHEAVRIGSADLLELLVQEGADVNAANDNGLTPLHMAAYLGARDTADVLIARGADVNAKARDGITPLHTAAQMGRLGVVQLLIERQADPLARSTSDGSTPEELASRLGHTDIAQFLSSARV